MRKNATGAIFRSAWESQPAGRQATGTNSLVGDGKTE